MSREPSSPMHRGWGAFEQPPPAEPATPVKRQTPRVRVEGAGRDKAMQKLMTTTEKLTREERRILRGYRLSVGGDTSRLERMRVELDIAMGRDQ